MQTLLQPVSFASCPICWTLWWQSESFNTSPHPLTMHLILFGSRTSKFARVSAAVFIHKFTLLCTVAHSTMHLRTGIPMSPVRVRVCAGAVECIREAFRNIWMVKSGNVLYKYLERVEIWNCTGFHWWSSTGLPLTPRHRHIQLECRNPFQFSGNTVEIKDRRIFHLFNEFL